MVESAELRAQQLLEANNAYVAKNRLLRAFVKKAEEQFTYYAKNHTAKAEKLIAGGDRSPETEQAVNDTQNKARVNEGFAKEALEVLEATKPA